MAIVYKNIVTEPNEKIDEAQANFASFAEFNAAGGVASYSDGPIYIGQAQLISQSGKLVDVNGVMASSSIGISFKERQFNNPFNFSSLYVSSGLSL